MRMTAASCQHRTCRPSTHCNLSGQDSSLSSALGKAEIVHSTWSKQITFAKKPQANQRIDYGIDAKGLPPDNLAHLVDHRDTYLSSSNLPIEIQENS